MVYLNLITRLVTLAFFLLLLLSADAQAIDPGKRLTQYAQSAWKTDNGLPHNIVRELIQTRDGYIWLATQIGAVRFDGVNFTVFNSRNTEQFKHNYITNLFEDNEGALWIATANGLIQLKNGRFTRYGIEEGLPDTSISAVVQTRDGSIWFGSNSGLNRLKEGKFTLYAAKDGLPEAKIRPALVDRDDNIWIIAPSGKVYICKGGQFTEFKLRNERGEEEATPMTGLCQGKDGSIWIRTKVGGLKRYKDGQFTTCIERNELNEKVDVRSPILEDKDGSIWVGGVGLTRYRDGSSITFTDKDGLQGQRITGMYEDREGSLWLGTLDGLFRFSDGKFTTYRTQDGLASDSVGTLFDSPDGGLWVGGANAGLSRIKDGKITTYPLKDIPAKATIYSVYETRDGSLWIGTGGYGLWRLKEGRLTSYTEKNGLPNDYVRSLLEDRDGFLWIGTDTGLARYKDGKLTALSNQDEFPAIAVGTLFQSKDGTLWIGTDGKLIKFKDGRFLSYDPKEGLASAGITSILEDDDGTLWIATTGGLNRYKDGKFIVFSDKEGLYSNAVTQLVEDDHGNFWIGSNTGIFSVSKQQLNDFSDGKISSLTCNVYGIADGLKSLDCIGGTCPSARKTRDGKLWFLTRAGLSVIDPQKIALNQVIPPVGFVQVIIDKQEVCPALYLQIPPGKGELEFHYAAGSYVAPERVRFKYKLEGYDKEWVDAGTRRVAYYTNIGPGKYRFRVIACNSDGIWNETGTSFEFYLDPHFYQTHWFYGLCALAVLMIGAAILNLRIGQLKRREKWLEMRVDERTGELKQEIIERKRAENEIFSQKTRFEQLFKNSPVAIVMLDESDRVQQVNKSFEDIFQYSMEEVRAKQINSLIVPDSLAQEAAILSEATLQGQITEKESIRRRKDANLVSVEIYGVPIILDGKREGTYGMYVDITERKQAEVDLRQAKEAAEAATRAKSLFLANMSHEIRTPMNAIIGMTGLLLDCDLSIEERDFVETIRTSGDALLTIINDILDFSKIESGKLDLEQVPFDLSDCLEEALDLFAAKAAEKSLELAYTTDSHVPDAIIGDITRLRQIFVNLINNAIKFTHKGEVTISVHSSKLEYDLHEIHFEVRDTGIGIPEDRMDRLFRSFSQVDSSTTRNYGGTGLGLVISKRLSEMMGGKMWVESRPGIGSTFHFTIRAQSAPSQSRLYYNSIQPQLSGKRLLIVDDNETNRRILVHQATSWGLRAEAVASGKEALQMLSDGKRFDLAILDMHMPEMDGAMLASEVRKRKAGEQIPLVMLSSGYGSKRELAERNVEELFAAILMKPIKRSQLYDTLIMVITGERVKARQQTTREIDNRLAERLPLRILLAEDNMVNQKLALRLLERMGYHADVAGNGLEVLEAMKRQRYDLVLMDVHMPEMDGLEAARQICRRWPERRPQIVAMTANAMQGDREECLGAGMDDYVSKPVRIAELVKALERCARALADNSAVTR